MIQGESRQKMEQGLKKGGLTYQSPPQMACPVDGWPLPRSSSTCGQSRLTLTQASGLHPRIQDIGRLSRVHKKTITTLAGTVGKISHPNIFRVKVKDEGRNGRLYKGGDILLYIVAYIGQILIGSWFKEKAL